MTTFHSSGVRLIVVQSEGDTPGITMYKYGRHETWYSHSEDICYHPMWVFPLHTDGGILTTMVLLYDICGIVRRRWGSCGWSSYTAKSCLWFYGKNLSSGLSWSQELKNPERVLIPQSSPERAAIIVEYVFLIQLESTRNKAAPTYIVHLFYSIASQSFSVQSMHVLLQCKNLYVATCNMKCGPSSHAVTITLHHGPV